MFPTLFIKLHLLDFVEKRNMLVGGPERDAERDLAIVVLEEEEIQIFHLSSGERATTRMNHQFQRPGK